MRQPPPHNDASVTARNDGANAPLRALKRSVELPGNDIVAADGLDLGVFLALVIRARWKIAGFVAACTLATAVTVLVLPKSYKATVLVSVVTGTGTSSLLSGVAPLLSQISGLGSLAGLSFSGDSKKAESVAVLESDQLTERYIAENRLLPILYARLWDREAQRWKVTDPAQIPTLWKANQYFKKGIRTVSTDPRTGLVTLEIDWKDPRLAATWANDLVKMTNDYLRRKAIEESDRNIAYLNEQAAKTDVVGVKEAIYTILQNEINKEMLARGTDEYAFKVLDPAIPPERPSFPRPRLSIALALVGSIALSLLAIFARVAWARP